MDSVKDKIEKLLAMGQDSRTNPHEAETPLRQAAALIAKHNIDVAELGARSGQAPKYDWITSTVAPDPRRASSKPLTWLGQVALGVARFTDTVCAWQRAPDLSLRMRFFGDRVDVETAVWLTEHLRDSIRVLSARYPGRRAVREDFRRAMVARLICRMDSLHAERRAALAEAHAGTGNALMVVDDKIAQRGKQFGEQTVQKSAKRNFRSAHAIAAGTHAGQIVSLTRGMTNGSAATGGAP